MPSLNKVMLIGRLGQDPKITYTASGQAVANFSLATDEGYKDKATGQKVERTEWHRVVAWRQLADFVGNYLSKGRLVYVEGRLQTRKWQDQQGQDRYAVEVLASAVQGLDQRPQQQGQAAQGRSQPGQNRPSSGDDMGPAFPVSPSGMDDVPF
jgi:single-strand DNA-binding protein